MKITERTATWRRERRVLLRVSRAAWRLEEAERERSWALTSARAEAVSIRALAAAVGLSSSRVHQIVAAADLDELDAALGELRAWAGRPRKTPMAMTTLSEQLIRLRQPNCQLGSRKTRQLLRGRHTSHIRQ